MKFLHDLYIAATLAVFTVLSVFYLTGHMKGFCREGIGCALIFINYN